VSRTPTAAALFKLHRHHIGELLVYNYHRLLTWLLIRLRKGRKGIVKSVAIKTVLKRVRGLAAALLLLQPSSLALVIRMSPCLVSYGHPSRSIGCRQSMPISTPYRRQDLSSPLEPVGLLPCNLAGLISVLPRFGFRLHPRQKFDSRMSLRPLFLLSC
jgi:hypothetical protein